MVFNFTLSPKGMQIGNTFYFEGHGNSGYAELCCNTESTGEVDALLKEPDVQLSEIPRQALFLASKAHVTYRKQGGSRTTGLPDFFIGAHAQVLGLAILTRDPGRYKTYFPALPLICP